jgi:hypothetical protein
MLALNSLVGANVQMCKYANVQNLAYWFLLDRGVLMC